MFNRQHFNRGRFNRSSVAVNSVFLHGDMGLGLETAGELNVSSAFNGNAALELTAVGKMTYSANLEGYVDLFLVMDGQVIRPRPLKGNADLSLNVEGKIARYRNFDGDALLMIAVISEGFNTFRYETISLPGLVIQAGEELIIDMENMTVTLNGQNVMRFLSRDSEFFHLNPGNNEVTYESTVSTGRVDLRILWKNAWL